MIVSIATPVASLNWRDEIAMSNCVGGSSSASGFLYILRRNMCGGASPSCEDMCGDVNKPKHKIDPGIT